MPLVKRETGLFKYFLLFRYFKYLSGFLKLLFKCIFKLLFKCNLWKMSSSLLPSISSTWEITGVVTLLLSDDSIGLILLHCRSLSSAFVGLSFCKYQKQWESSLLLANKSITTRKSMSAFLIYLFRIFHLLPSGSNDKYLEAECSFKVVFF